MPLPTTGPAPRTSQGRPPKGYDYTFANWVEERSKMTPEEIFDVEAKSQGLVKDTKPQESKKKKTKAKTTPVPQRLKYPQGFLNAYPGGFTITGAGSRVIVAPKAGFHAFCTCLAFTVTGDTTVSLTIGGMAASGPMKFGGVDEPRGMVIPFPGDGWALKANSLSITNSGAGVTLAGLCAFKYEELKKA